MLLLLSKNDLCGTPIECRNALDYKTNPPDTSMTCPVI